MPIGREDAAQAPKAAEDAAGRSALAHGYRGASGFLILWGVVWAVMDIGYFLGPQSGGLLSLAGDVVGIGGSVILGARMRRARPGGYPMRGVLSALTVALAIGLFGLGISAVMTIQTADQGQAIAGLAVGCVYVALGASQGFRLSAVGLGMVALTLGGWFFARDQFMLWMAVAGGGGLVASGLWLRTA
jgi:hypothetical protein